MMDTNTETQKEMVLKFGQFEVEQAEAGNTTLKLVCRVDGPTAFSLLLLDELGRLRFEEKLLLEKEKGLLEFGLPKLQPGRYNAWIEVGGKTYIRPLNIEGKEKEGWLQRLKRFAFH